VIDGAHVIVYSTDADADRAFLSDVLGLKGVDAGGGWLIFALPPSEVAVHPFKRNDAHELFFLTKDMKKFTSAMKERKVPVSAMQTERWGYVVRITLPGGGTISVYEPRHARASSATRRAPPRRSRAERG
jgi:hypothetical protein